MKSEVAWVHIKAVTNIIQLHDISRNEGEEESEDIQQKKSEMEDDAIVQQMMNVEETKVLPSLTPLPLSLPL